jgi:hypothetical protein
MSMSMRVGLSNSMLMFIPTPSILVSLGEIQNPNCPTLHDRHDPTSNLLNVVPPGFYDLPFIPILGVIGVMSMSVFILMFIPMSMSMSVLVGSYETKSSQKVSERSTHTHPFLAAMTRCMGLRQYPHLPSFDRMRYLGRGEVRNRPREGDDPNRNNSGACGYLSALSL